MTVKRVEGLLAEYARYRPAERLFSREVSRQLRSQLRPPGPPKPGLSEDGETNDEPPFEGVHHGD